MTFGGIVVAVKGASQCDVGGADAEHYRASFGENGEFWCVLYPALKQDHDAFTEYVPDWGLIAGGVGAAWLGLRVITRWSLVEVSKSRNGVGVAMSVALGS